jgi:hypothetical protein
MSPLARRVWNLLTDEPQSRFDLQSKLAVWNEKGIAICPPERKVRKAIEELRSLGYNVASNSDTKGYWRGTKADKERTIKEYRARATKLLQTAEALEEGPDIGQIQMEA